MNEFWNSVILVAVAALVTCLLRAVPFVLFSGSRSMSPSVKRIVSYFPAAIMGVLVIYCIKGDIISVKLSLTSSASELVSPIATLIALAVVVVLHLWKRMTLLSIAAGTVVYMTLIRIL